MKKLNSASSTRNKIPQALERLRNAVIALIFLLLLGSCSRYGAARYPSIVFTRVPPFGMGNPVRINAIEGRVTGVLPGEKIVLYAKSGVWWVQPFSNQPFTTVDAGSVWRGSTHPGYEYAALLVKDGFHPSSKVDKLPEKGGAVLAVATIKGPASSPPDEKTLVFGGYPWTIQKVFNTPGGTPNYYDPDNAWTDRSGFLHLRIAGNQKHWTSAEVNLRRSLGYGTYRFVIRDVAHLAPSVVFTMLTWDDHGPPREMDIEVSRWGETEAKNCQFVIQPYFVPANSVQFELPAGLVTFMLRWSPGRAAFRAYRGDAARWDGPAIGEHVFTSGVPSPGAELVHMDFYVFGDTANPLKHGSEVIVEKFQFLP